MIDESNVTISKSRHIGIKIAVFVGAILVSATLIVLYAVGAFSHFSGYAQIDAVADKETPYGGEYNCLLYFEGSTMAVNSQKSKAQQVYSEALRDAYRKSEDSVVKEDVVSIANVNVNLGATTSVDQGTYDLLKRAHGYAQNHANYSLYSAPLFAEWEHIATIHSQNLDPSVDIDPAIDEQEAAYLNEIASFVNNPDSVNLTFLENNQIRLTISEAYAAFRKANDITAPILSLTSLRPAYCLEQASKALEEAGYQDGYLRHDYGLGVALSKTPSLVHTVYGLSENGAVEDSARLGLTGGHCFAKLVRYNVHQCVFPIFYSLKKEGKTLYRSPYLNLDKAEGNQYCHSSYLFSSKKGIVDVALSALDGLAVETEADWQEYLPTLNGYDYLFVKGSNPTAILISSSLKEQTVILKPQRYTLNEI